MGSYGGWKLSAIQNKEPTLLVMIRKNQYGVLQKLPGVPQPTTEMHYSVAGCDWSRPAPVAMLLDPRDPPALFPTCLSAMMKGRDLVHSSSSRPPVNLISCNYLPDAELELELRAWEISAGQKRQMFLNIEEEPCYLCFLGILQNTDENRSFCLTVSHWTMETANWWLLNQC